jgi:5-methylcytosine-specific restriction protein B
MSIRVEQVVEALKQHKNVLLYGPPGTGKSHLMKRVANHLESDAASRSASVIAIDTAEERTPFSVQSYSGIVTRWVTFHQGYSYEDFILGMRPISSEKGGFSIKPRPGVLLELVAEARRGGEGLLLIDEINRGNTSRIFGEFITLMEEDKRLDSQGNATNSTVTITLPYLSPAETVDIETSGGTESIGREFSMPANIYTLASMNSVDKSVAPIDTALRRRFHVINLAPTREGIAAAVGLQENDALRTAEVGADLTSEDIAVLAASILIKLNRSIGLYLGSDFMLGQWYLAPLSQMDIEDAKASLVESWLFRLVPQLIELFHGRDEQLITCLGVGKHHLKRLGITVVEPSGDEVEYGATTYIEILSSAPEENALIESLQRLIGSPEPNREA